MLDPEFESVQTPLSNTGSNQQKKLVSSIDYFQGTSIFPNLERMHQALDFAFGQCEDLYAVVPGKPFMSGVVWESSGISTRGGKIGYRQLPDGTYHCWLSIPGSCLHQLDGRSQYRLFTGLYHTFRFKATRIDFKVRDYSRRKTPIEIHEQARLGNVARVKSYEYSGSAKIGHAPVETCYLGSRQSEKFLRIYDALPVHGENAIDWEVQLRDEKAHSAYSQLANIPSCEDTDLLISQYIGAVVCGAVEFIDRQIGRQLQRQSRQDWWLNFVDECGGRISICVAKPTRSLQRTLDWIDRQVAVQLSALRSGLGRANFHLYLTNLLDQSESRFQPIHEMLIKLCRAEQCV